MNSEKVDVQLSLNDVEDMLNDSIDDLVDELIDDEKIKAINEDANNLKITRYSLNQRINDHVCDLFDNEKFVRKNKPKNSNKTGQLLKINEISPLLRRQDTSATKKTITRI